MECGPESQSSCISSDDGQICSGKIFLWNCILATNLVYFVGAGACDCGTCRCQAGYSGSLCECHDAACQGADGVCRNFPIIPLFEFFHRLCATDMATVHVELVNVTVNIRERCAKRWYLQKPLKPLKANLQPQKVVENIVMKVFIYSSLKIFRLRSWAQTWADRWIRIERWTWKWSYEFNTNGRQWNSCHTAYMERFWSYHLLFAGIVDVAQMSWSQQL